MHNKHTYHSARVSSPSLRAGRVLSVACMALVAVFAILTMRDESALRAALVQTQNRITEIKDRKKTESSPSGTAQAGSASARTLSSSVSLTAATPDVRQMLINRTQRLQQRLVQSGVSLREAAGIAAASALSTPLAGRDGQVLMLKNGKEVWVTLTDLDIVQSDPPSRHAPYSTEGGEWRNYGGGNPTSTSVSGGSNIDLPLNILRDTTGILGYNRGGTGIDSYSSGDLLVGLQAGNLGKISLGDAGFVLTSSGGSPRWMSAASVAAAGGWIDDGSVVRLLTSGDSVGIGTVSPDAKLDVIGTISGSTLAASTLLRSSGGLVVENGNISINGVVYSFTSSQGGLNTFLKNDGAGALTWSTLPPGFGSGQVITIGDPRFVNASGDTMTGTLVIQNGSTHTATSTPLLNVRGTMSGKLLWITGTGSLPLLSMAPQTGTVMFGTGGFKQTGAGIFPVLGSAPRPKIAGSVATGANPFGIAVADHYAYVVNGGDSTLQIYDLTNPAAPASLGSVGTRSFPYSVAVQGRYAYVTTYTTATSSLQIFDVSNPSAPTAVGFVSTAANPVRVVVAGRYAYVVTEGTERLQIIDISNPTSPEIVASSSLDFEGPSSLAVAGNYVYTSDSVNGAMIIFDVSNPKSPRRVSNTSALSQPQDIVVQGRYAYIASKGAGRLQIFDISNPASPSSMSSLLAGADIQKLAIAGRYVYALRQGSTGMQVFDVSNPTSPVNLGVFSTDTAPSGIALSGRYAYIVNDSSGTLQVYDLGGAYLNAAEIGSLESTSISVADTLNARSITARGSLQVGQGGLQVQGPSAFMNTSTGAYALQILSGTGGLRIAARTSAQAHITFGTGTTFDTSLWRKGAAILKTNGTFEAAAFSGKTLTITGTGSGLSPLIATDLRYGTIMMGTGAMKNGSGSIAAQLYVTGKINPTPVGSLSTGLVGAIALQGRTLFVGSQFSSNVGVYDVTNPQNIGSYSSIAAANHVCVAVQGKYLYSSHYRNGTFRIVDISDPASPVLKGSLTDTTGAACASILVQGNYLYEVNTDQIFQVYDISDPNAPKIIKTYTMTQDMSGSKMAFLGKYIVISGNSFLIVLDVSNPRNPVQVGSAIFGNGIATIDIQNKYGYLGRNSTFFVYDFSNPASPVQMSSVTVSGTPNSMVAQGRYVYAAFTGGLYVFDVSNPRVPVQIQFISTVVPTYMKVQGRYLYTNDASGVVRIFDLGGAYVQQLEAGGIETNDLYVRNGLRVLNADVAGSLTVGAGLQVQGPSSFLSTSTGSVALRITSTYSGALMIAARGTSAAPHISFGTGNTFDTKLWRKGAQILKTNGTFEASTFSGTSLYISGTGAGVSPLLATDTRFGSLLIGTGSLKAGGSGSMAPQLYITGRVSSGALVGSTTTNLASAIQEIVVQGRYAYTANYGGTFSIHDVSNPTNPVSVGTLNIGLSPCAVKVQGRYAYVIACVSNSLVVVDISNPTAPFAVSSYSGLNNATSLAVQGPYVYEFNTLGTEGLTVFDVSNPAAIKKIGGFGMAGNPNAGTVQGKYLYALSGNTMYIIDISNPASPKVMASTTTNLASPKNVVIQGKYAYIANYNGGLAIFDISNPSSPAAISSTSTGLSGPNHVEVQGRYAYLVNFNSSTFVAYDISNPRVPKLAYTISPNITNPRNVAVQGRYAYVVSDNNRLSIFDLGGAYIQQLEVGGLEVNDLSVQNGIRAIDGDFRGGLSVLGGINVQKSSSFLETSTGAVALKITGTYSGALMIAARGTSAAPHITFGTGTTFDTSLWRKGAAILKTNGTFEASAFSGRTLYISGTGAGVSPLIATDNRFGAILMGTGALRAGGSGSMAPQLYVAGRGGSGSAAVRVGSVTGLTAAISSVVQGRYAYVLSSTALNIIDITNSTAPRSVGSTVSGLSSPQGVFVQGRYAYVTSLGNSALVIFDISNPTSPTKISSSTSGLSNPSGVYVQGRYAYVTNIGSEALVIYDVADPSAPVRLGSIVAGMVNPYSIVVQGRYAYVTSYSNSTFVIFDISNPNNPLKVSSITTGLSQPFDVAVQGKYAYVVNETNSALVTFDISDPTTPKSVSSTTNGLNTAYSVVVQGRYAYVGSYSNNSLVIFDISNPSTPVRVASTMAGISTPYYKAVAVQGRYAYVASYGNSSFVVLDLGGAYVQQLEVGSLETADLSVRNGLRALDGDFRGGVSILGGLNAQKSSSFLETSTGSVALKITSTYSGALVIAARGTSAAPHIWFGTGNTFDTSLRRSAAGVLTTDGKMSIGTGSNILAQHTIFTTDALNQPALYIHSAETTSTQDMFQIRTNVSSTNNLVFRITASGGVYSDAPYNSAGADYAEYFPSDAHVKIPGGKVVCLDATKENLVKVCDREADPNIIGITSIRPSVVGNAVAGTILNDLGLPVPGYTLVGLIGQLDSTATTMGTGGTIRTGDSLTSSSIPGVLRKALPGESTVGVALTGLSSGQGSIRVLIARSNKSLTVEAVEQRVSQSVANLKVDDQIKTSLEKTLGESSFDQRIASAVSSQVASLLPLQDRVSTIEAQLAELASTLSPSSDGGGKPEGQGGGNLTLTGSLAANTLSAEETLTVGRDARIGGDLFLEGALIMTGDASFSGNVTTGKLTAASGSQIDGTLSIAGDLLIGKNLILGSGSTLTADQLIVANAFFVRGPVTIDGLATFFGNVDIKGELKVSTRQAGYALVKAGESKVIVRFDPPFAATPIVTASPDIPVLFAVSKATATGFTISLKSSEAQDITFSYTALTTDSPRTASGSFAEAPTGTIVFPLDAQGVPVSSSSIWNACIRHQQPLDPVTGQPFSCTRYTPDLYIWTHPDFPNMTFVWNDSYTPPLLVLPENYVRQIVTTSSSSSSDGSGSSVSSSSESSSSSDSSSSDSSSSNSSSSEQSSSSDSSSSDSSSSSSDSSSLDSSSSEGSSSSQ